MSNVTKFPTSENQVANGGTRAWNSIGALGADDTSYNVAYTMTAGGWDWVIQLLSSGNLAGSNKKSGSQYPTSMAAATYGGSTDKWGVSLTPSIVNASDFGIGIMVAGNSSGGYSSYLDKVTGFGFSIPTAASIDGVLATIARYASGGYTYVDYATLNVYYTVASGPAGLKTFDGLAKASIKVVNGLAIASVKGIDGLT